MFSRTDKSVFGEWYWTVDRWLLGIVLVLMMAGMLFSLSASPPVALRLGLSEYHFSIRHFIFLFPALIILLGTSLLSKTALRRAALAVFVIGLLLMVLAIGFGPVVKGATRWVSIGGLSLQPSEFVKPAFIILTAWLFSERVRYPDMPINKIAFALYVVFVTVLILQPDYGQTVLLTLVWLALFFMAGLSWLWTGIFAGLGALGLGMAYLFVPHVTKRIDRFLQPGTGDTFQVDRALEAFAHGGWFGAGPGEGTVKRILPDAHTDFIFAVIGEEFGVVVCLILLGLFGIIVLRGLRRAMSDADPFVQLCVSGLIIMFGLQAVINMGVNVSLLPAKGMTLPFISYGGSSLLASAFTMGAVLALTRERLSEAWRRGHE